jgi:hypothetical protein
MENKNTDYRRRAAEARDRAQKCFHLAEREHWTKAAAYWDSLALTQEKAKARGERGTEAETRNRH